MKLKNSFFYTLREDVKDEESISGNLLVRAGFIKKSSSGVYMILPLGLRVLRNIEKIVREEMNNAGSQELIMPCMIPEEVFIKSGRRDNFGDDMMSFKDRMGRDYVLGPTHEELFLAAAAMKVKSYKDMPFNMYQMFTKFRDEPRPRYGLLRTREFTMKDAYSFDATIESAKESYKKMYDAYVKIFDRIGFNYKIVTADTGLMGGLLSEEFQVLADIGEDTLALCDKCDFAKNIEVCECVTSKEKENEEELEKELVETPNVGTIEDLEKFGFDISKMVKTLIYKIDDKFYACCLPGDRNANEINIVKAVGGTSIELADEDNVKRITNARVGFAGPVNIEIPIILDEDVLKMKNFVVGANKSDHHYKNVNIKDLGEYTVANIKEVKDGDICPKCGGHLQFKTAIEVGNTFLLGDKYSKAVDFTYLDKNNEQQYPIMGSYGIGIERVMAAYIEQNNDENGMIWPLHLAPYKVAIVLINKDGEEYANEIYDKLNELGVSVILDDRDERPGVKFKDMDLIGIPIRITIGRGFNDGKLEITLRNTKETKEINKEKLISEIKKLVK